MSDSDLTHSRNDALADGRRRFYLTVAIIFWSTLAKASSISFIHCVRLNVYHDDYKEVVFFCGAIMRKIPPRPKGKSFTMHIMTSIYTIQTLTHMNQCRRALSLSLNHSRIPCACIPGVLAYTRHVKRQLDGLTTHFSSFYSET